MEQKYNQLNDLKIQEKWQNEKTFIFNKDERPVFSIDTPPPTVSGTLHIGHVFSYTQTDIIARFKRLCGFNVFYPFGFDDNGLATERFVEKKNKVSGHSMPRSEFINLCIKESTECAKEFKSLWTCLGISADWSKTYSTISPLVSKISQKSFIDLYKKDFIYRRQESAPYCTTCFTSVAQAELDDAPFQSYFNTIEFSIANSDETISIATTRPELLASCVAIFYNPEDLRFVNLKGKKAIVPIFNFEVEILPDDLVDIQKGTGLVMCCTFGDKTDLLWYKKHNLKYKPSIGLDGKFNENTGMLFGLKVHTARTVILEQLQKDGYLIEQKAITHNVNVHERCKKEVEFLIIEQWFLKILEHKHEFLKLIDQVNWNPIFMKARCKDWIENLQWDWCLSRQRFYGIPFPVWHCKSCKFIIIPCESQLPLDPKEIKIENCPECKSPEIIADTDVMDTWNTSSLTPYICNELIKEPMSNPMSMRPQAHDIIRTWAFYTIIKTWMHDGIIPWTDIVISGHVLTTSKEKISKSKENASTDPVNLLKIYPADAIRYWTASACLGQDVSFSEGQLKVGQKLITKLWNAFRFIKEHCQSIDLTDTPENFSLINEWLLNKKTETFEHYKKYLNQNEPSLALSSIERFFFNDFCDNYLEIIKDQLFNPENYNSEIVNATKWTLNHVGLSILQMLSIYLPHITETIFEEIYKNNLNINSIALTEFKSIQIKFDFENATHNANSLLYIASLVRKLKTEKEVSLKTEISTILLYNVDVNTLKIIASNEQLIKGVTNSKDIIYLTGKCESFGFHQINDQWQISIELGQK